MLGLFATLVFVAAGCTSAAVIGTSLRNALPALRRLAAEQRSLAEDRVYLYTLIETPRHSATQLPLVAPTAAAARVAGAAPVRRRVPALAPMRAAA